MKQIAHSTEQVVSGKSMHTAGPWKVSGLVSKAFHVLSPSGYVIASVDKGNAYKAQQLANARLIAAAPDLLAALGLIANTKTQHLRSNQMQAAIVGMKDAARAAISKAVM